MARELRVDPLGTLMDNFRRYGDLVLYRVGPARGPGWMQKDTVAVHHPDGVQQVLTNDEVFTRRTVAYRVLAEMFGQNLATTNGDVWRRQRRALQPLFTPRQVESYAPLMEAEAQRVVHDQDVASGGVMDIAEMMEAYALRVLGRTLFKAEQAIDEDTVAALGRLVPVVGELVPSRVTQIVRLPLAWPSPRNRRFVQTRVGLYSAVDRVLAKRAAAGARDAGDDLLGRLREAREPGTGEPLSAQEIRDQALVFLLAGQTTTADALTATLHLLASNPEAQEQVAEAAARSGPRDDSDLVAAAVLEGMRLYPPSSVLARRVITDAEIDGRVIGAETNVLVSAWVTHRHPEFWGEPDRFDPWRFVGDGQRPPYAYFPFGGGGRTCIGRHFAVLEASIMVRELLKAYRLVALDSDIPMAQRISLRPSGPVLVKCQRR